MDTHPDARFAVISDLHFYDASLGAEGAAFEKALSMDRKMLAESEELLDYAISDLLRSDIQFLLICGDLTKDGEAINHEKVSAKLQTLADNGIKVIVTPGNHDINNPGAVGFSGDEKWMAANTSAQEFRRIYADMGYGDCFISDDSSLSYVSEPVPGLWVLSIDTCRYDENSTEGESAVTGGSISAGTEEWILSVLSEASAHGKTVIALMHHGIVEHWKGQAKIHPDYLVKGFGRLGGLLASHNVRLAFTGHNHAQSIVRADFGDNFLCDVGTGSLVTYPCPIRYCELDVGDLKINTNTIAEKLRTETDFAEIAESIVKKNIAHEVARSLREYYVSDCDAEYIADAVGEAFSAHYKGDAAASFRPEFDFNSLGLLGKFVYATQKQIIDALWESSLLGDNNTVLNLQGAPVSERVWNGEIVFAHRLFAESNSA